MSELFADKYHPQTLDDFIGDITTLEFYIKESLKNKTKDKGFILYGSPGTGKSTIVNLMAKKFGIDLIITNSSDKRNSINASSFYTGSILSDRKKLVVFDEADGMTEKAFKELGKVISNYSPIILIANDISKIPNYIKSKCFIKEVVTNKFNLKALATKIIEKESIEIDGKELNDNLVAIDSYRSLFDFLQFGITSNKESFNTNKDDLKSEIQFISDNSSNPNLISQADIFFKRSQLGYKKGSAISKYILNNINVKSSDYPRTYKFIYEAKSKKKNKSGPLKILGFK